MLIYICEDSKSDTLRLRHHLDSYARKQHYELEIVAFSSGRELTDAYSVSDRQPDLLFLDIYMDGENGMDLAKKLRRTGFCGGIIFTTSSTEHAMDSYEVNALYYLQKPYTHSHFLNAMERCSHILAKAQQTFTFTSRKHTYTVPYRDIIYFETGQHTVILHTVTDLYVFPGSLSQITDSLRSAENFLSVGRSFLINLDHVAGHRLNDLLMSDQSIVQVPLRKQEEVRMIVEKWQQEKPELS